jgi:inosose dehydratase
MLDRRKFVATCFAAAAVRAYGMPGDRFRWACTSGMFRTMPNQPDDTLKMLSNYGYQGIEASMLLESSCKGGAREFKSKLDSYNIACANYWGAGTYWDPANPAEVRATVANNIALARDHIAVCGGHSLKVNLNARDIKAHPKPGWWTNDQITVLANTLNEIGKGCAAAGVQFVVHPHNWTLIDTDSTEISRIMDLTDPKLVYLVADTAHLSLGGTDPVRFVDDWFPRIGDVHLKDVLVKYSPSRGGWKGPAPTREEHEKDNLYKQFATGGVDFEGFMAKLRAKGYDKWVSLDFDPPRPGEGSLKENMDFRRKYVVDKLHADLGPLKV